MVISVGGTKVFPARKCARMNVWARALFKGTSTVKDLFFLKQGGNGRARTTFTCLFNEEIYETTL